MTHEPPNPSWKCLVVDDSGIVRRIAAGILGDMGFECEEATDGAHAYEICKSQDMPDLILLDVNMPVMDGYEFIEKLRSIPNGDHPRVILCTTDRGMDNINRAIKYGVDEYITKPFDRDTLHVKLQQIGMAQDG